ncbi:MAG: DUF59 domain-containing protein [Phycisphaera sp.]|nr:DUF59 domain-containing protein [Phycisphaera sp.]
MCEATHAAAGSTSDAPDASTDATDTPEKTDAQQSLEDKIVAALRKVHDPEIPINIYDLGLIYRVEVSDDPDVEPGAEACKKVKVVMTLTTPHCPEAQSIPGYVKHAVETVKAVSEASVEIVWDPAWSKDRMSDEAKLQLGMF